MQKDDSPRGGSGLELSEESDAPEKIPGKRFTFQKHLQVERVLQIVKENEGKILPQKLVALIEVTPPHLGHEKAFELVEALLRAELLKLENVVLPDGSSKEMIVDAHSIR